MKLLPVLLLQFFLVKCIVKANTAVNDLCVDALPIAIGSTWGIDLMDATIDNDVSSECIYTGPPTCPGAWYTFEGTGERLVFKSCDVPNIGYTILSIYKGDCNATNLECAAGAYNPCRRGLVFDTEEGTLYHLLIQSFYGGKVDSSIFVAPPVENDFCINALPIAIGSTVFANTTYATSDNVDVSSNCIDNNPPSYPGTWYTFEGTGEQLVLRSCDVPDKFYTAFSIFEGACGATNLECVTGALKLCDTESFVLDTREGITYHVLIQSDSDVSVDFSVSTASCGLFGLSIFCPCRFQGFFGRLIGQLFGC
jgi:hypothetical protein